MEGEYIGKQLTNTNVSYHKDARLRLSSHSIITCHGYLRSANGLVSNTLIQNKGKGIPKRKNTAGSVQVGLEVVEEEKEEKVSEVRVSTRGRIIRNTRKM